MTATQAGSSRVIGDATVTELAAQLRGEVIRPGDDGYDEARALWNGMHDRHPAVIVRCAGVSDVVAAVRFGRSECLEIAVRGGGHSIPGFSAVDGGLMIDLSQMRGVHVDARSRRAYVEGGATWRDVDVETQLHGLATTGGLVSTTGVGGFTLGGGIGWLMRKHGLAADNMVGAELVTADGDVVNVSESENPELLWALRGGGGNFGIVTRFEFKLHEVGPMLAGGAIFYPGDKAESVLKGWREWLQSAPDEVTTLANLATAPPAPFLPEEWHGQRVVAIGALHAGSVDEGLEVLAPLRSLAEPVVADLLGPIPYLGQQGLFDPLHPKGDGNYFKSLHLQDLSDAAIDTLTFAHRSVTSPRSEIHVHDMRGAVARGPAGGSAFPNRDAPYVLNVIGKWTGSGPGPDHIAWARDVVASMEEHSTGTGYVNFLGDSEDGGTLKAAYGAEAYDRLVQAKDEYDSENVFHHNQNIAPSGG